MNCNISFGLFAVCSFVFFVHGALLAGVVERTWNAGQGGKPNIILILTDDQGSGDWSSHRFQCATLHNVEKGEKKAIYTEQNAPYHWGVTPPGHWALFDVKKDSCCEKDLDQAEPERVAAMAAAYDKWWDNLYPVMVERGGDREFVWNVPTSDKAKGATAEAKPAR